MSVITSRRPWRLFISDKKDEDSGSGLEWKFSNQVLPHNAIGESWLSTENCPFPVKHSRFEVWGAAKHPTQQ
jgi:hypothetical protein